MHPQRNDRGGEHEGTDAEVLARARRLQVEHLGHDRYRVTGGREPHVVDLTGPAALCDCGDRQHRGRICKHILAVTLHNGSDGGAPAVWDEVAEQAVLSAMLLDAAAARKAAALLGEGSFYREAHRLLFRAMVALAERDTVIDPVTLHDELLQRGDLERVGGMEYVATLIDVVPTAAGVEHHAQIVRRHAQRRALAPLARQLAALAADPTVDADALRRGLDDALALLRGPAAQRFHLLTPAELLECPAPAWLLEPYVPMGSLAVLYGPPGSGKSFLALAWALAVAGRQPWLGRAISGGAVVYVVAEGGSGLGQRFLTCCDAHGLTDPAIRFLREPVNLLDERDVTTLLDVTAGDLPVLYVFDTMARCMPGGDENSAQDVGRVIASADRIRRRNGAAVLLVHHTQKSGELERGSSALRGAADAMFALKNEDGLLTLECSKEKDAPEPPDTRLRLTPIGASCIVEPFEGSVPDVGLSRTRRAVLETIRDVQQDGWAATSVILRNVQATGVRERAIYSALRRLRELGYIEKKASRYALTTRAQEALGNCT